jgi:hypothetical protein
MTKAKGAVSLATDLTACLFETPPPCFRLPFAFARGEDTAPYLAAAQIHFVCVPTLIMKTSGEHEEAVVW